MNGKTSQKVFQLAEKIYAAGAHPMHKHYPGAHRLEIVVNGQQQAATTFELRQ